MEVVKRSERIGFDKGMLMIGVILRHLITNSSVENQKLLAFSYNNNIIN